MKWSKLKTMQSVILILGIIIEPIFIRVTGITNAVASAPWISQLLIEIVLLVGILRIIYIPIYFLTRKFVPSVFAFAPRQNSTTSASEKPTRQQT